MKRFALLFLSLVLLAIPAVSGATKIHVDNLNWHTSLADAFTYQAGDSFTVFRGTGLRNSAEQADTTQRIDILKFVMPGPVYTTTVASDSVAWLRLTLYPVGTSVTVAADTADISMQVSDDGTNWTSLVWTGPKISPDVASMGAVAALETGTSNNMSVVIRQVVGGVTQSVFNYLGTGAPTANQAYGFRYARFICRGDYTGVYDAILEGFVPDMDQNKNDN